MIFQVVPGTTEKILLCYSIKVYLFPLYLRTLPAFLVRQADFVALYRAVNSVQHPQELRLETFWNIHFTIFNDKSTSPSINCSMFYYT